MKPFPRVLLLATLDAIGVTRLPHLFHQAGCHVTVFAPRRLAVCRSRYIAQRIDAAPELDAYLEQLRQHLSATDYDWIIVCEEGLLWELARRRAATDGVVWPEGTQPSVPRPNVPGPDKTWIDRCLPVAVEKAGLITSKHRFLALAQVAELPVPPITICASLAMASEVAQRLGYPVILRAEHSMSGSGVRLAANPAELAQVYGELAQTSAVAVQRYIANARTAITEVLFDHGRLVAWNSAYLVAGWPTPLAASCVREPLDHPEIEPLLQCIGELTGFHGLGGVDWLHDTQTGQLHLVEFNPRPTPGYHLTARTGVDFAMALHGLLAGRIERQRPQLQPGAQPYDFLFPQYLYRAIDDQAYWRMMRAWRDVPWHDPLLVAAHLRRLCGHYLPTKWRAYLRRLRVEFSQSAAFNFRAAR